MKFNNPLSSKSMLKYLVYYLVFWVEVQHLQGQCISILALVFYYCIPENLAHEKTKSNVQKFFQIILSNKRKMFLYEKVLKVKKRLFFCLTFSHFSFFFLFFQFFSSVSCHVKQFLGGLHLF